MWLDREIPYIRPTRLRAAAAGFVAAAAIWMTELVVSGLSIEGSARNAVFVVVGVIFFFAPGYVFVLGMGEWKGWTLADTFLLTERGAQQFFRFMAWLLGALAFGMCFWILRGLSS